MQFHSMERVVEEMRYLKKKRPDDFWFTDPNFASSKKWLEQICNGISNGVHDIRFWCQGRYNLLDKDLIRLLKCAGAHTIAFGLESSDICTQKKLKKSVNPDKLAASWRDAS
ncbi:hypothetical protein [Desulfosediminicola sp.]|uniref:hypothetical protein n=1 Tax=Desulfosediminicola sp. TaxID=2886825 RepID=UPI003AF2954A